MTDEADTDLPPSEGSLSDGMRIIADFVRTLPRKPGVYRMIAADGEVLYVGKARSLRSRVAAYTQPTRLATRLIRSRISHIPIPTPTPTAASVSTTGTCLRFTMGRSSRLFYRLDAIAAAIVPSSR